MASMHDVTALLRRQAAGDADAGRQLLELLHDELHRLAGAQMRRERGDHTLQPTALVHEAWLRLVASPPSAAGSRAHFLSLAARVMRRVLVEHARARAAAKRGGEAQRVTLDDALALDPGRSLDVLALDEALERLAAFDAELATLVELRFFGGLSNEEVAASRGVSLRSVERGWATARAWLRGQLDGA